MSRPQSAARAFVAASLAAFLAAFAVAFAQDQPIQGGGNATKIQGRSVLSTAPTSGQALAWNGSAWAPAAVVASSSTTIAGDVTGTLAAATVAKLQGVAVVSSSPIASQVLAYSASYGWVPTTPSSGVSNLQGAYDGGRTITTSAAGTPVAITGAGSGSALTVVSGTISSEGAGGAGSERFGAESTADSAFALGVGYQAAAPDGYDTAVGGAASCAAGTTGGTALGAATTCGREAVAIGAFADATGRGSVAIGYDASATVANQLVAGSSGSAITDFVFGNGVTDGTPTATVTIRTTGGTGAADAGTALRLRTGVSGDGTTASGGILFGVAVVSSATAITDVLKIDGTTGQILVGGDLTASTVPGAGTVATFNGSVALKGSILPVADNTYDLGSASYRWQLIRGVTITSGTIVEEERFAAENFAGSARADSLRADLDATKVGPFDGRHLPRIALVSARHVLELEARLAALEGRLAK